MIDSEPLIKKTKQKSWFSVKLFALLVVGIVACVAFINHNSDAHTESMVAVKDSSSTGSISETPVNGVKGKKPTASEAKPKGKTSEHSENLDSETDVGPASDESAKTPPAPAADAKTQTDAKADDAKKEEEKKKEEDKKKEKDKKKEEDKKKDEPKDKDAKTPPVVVATPVKEDATPTGPVVKATPVKTDASQQTEEAKKDPKKTDATQETDEAKKDTKKPRAHGTKALN